MPAARGGDRQHGFAVPGDDWYEIRLVYVTPIEHPGAEKASTPDGQSQCFRLGLYRLGDTLDPNKKKADWSWPALRDNFSVVMPAHSPVIGFGMLFVTVVVILPVIVILFMRNVKGNFVGDESGLSKSIAATAKFENNEPDWEKLSPANKAKATIISQSDDNAGPLGRLANLQEELMHLIPSNPGASVFLLPEVIRQLHITEEQQRHLQQIVDATAQLITDLEGQVNEAISPDQYQKLFSTARGNAMQLLTDEQRSKWQNISGEKPQNKSPRPVKDDK